MHYSQFKLLWFLIGIITKVSTTPTPKSAGQSDGKVTYWNLFFLLKWDYTSVSQWGRREADGGVQESCQVRREIELRFGNNCLFLTVTCWSGSSELCHGWSLARYHPLDHSSMYCTELFGCSVNCLTSIFLER